MKIQMHTEHTFIAYDDDENEKLRVVIDGDNDVLITFLGDENKTSSYLSPADVKALCRLLTKASRLAKGAH